MAKQSILGAKTQGTAGGDVLGGGLRRAPRTRPRAPPSVRRIPRAVRNPKLQRFFRTAALMAAARGRQPTRRRDAGPARGDTPPWAFNMDFVLSKHTPGRILHRIVTTTKAARYYAKFTQYLESYAKRLTWVRMIHLVVVGAMPPAVAIEFLDGAVCYYPGTSEAQYESIKRSPSAGKHVWAYFYHRPYVIIAAGRAVARRRAADTHRRHGDPR